MSRARMINARALSLISYSLIAGVLSAGSASADPLTPDRPPLASAWEPALESAVHRNNVPHLGESPQLLAQTTDALPASAAANNAKQGITKNNR